MSYSPATKLSHSNATNKATVLTNGNVMVTLGLGVGQMMTLEDWRILADGAAIVEERAPLPVAPLPVAPLPAAPLPAAPLPAAPLPAAPLPAAPGCKFRWTLDENNYRVAIMTAKGLLEVKSVVNGVTEMVYTRVKKTLFPNETAWRASLPLDGRGTTELSDPLAEKTRADEAYHRLSDVEKVGALMKRYKARDEAWESSSPADSLKSSLGVIEAMRDNLNKLTLEEELENRRHRMNLALRRYLLSYFNNKRRVIAAGENANIKPLRIARRGTAHILATLDGVPHILTTFNGKIAAVEQSCMWSRVKLFNNFAEMGNPPITAFYRLRNITV